MDLEILVLDDEELNRAHVSDLILEYAPSAIVYQAESVADALNILEERKVDILFSDIKMPGQNSFDMLKELKNRSFSLVFITAYSEFALQALREGAIDYLLKPIRKSEFKSTFLKLLQLKKEREKNLASVVFNQGNNYLDGKLSLNHQQGIKFITLKDIMYLEAKNSYTILHLTDGDKVTTSKAINKFEVKLAPGYFFRIHKSFIINLFHFKEYLSKNGDFAVMNNGEKLYISRYRLNQFLEVLESQSGTI